ncbi:hypothetical protein [Williamsia sp.]|uniref:hypothetical protein n=1 Tax=Williamsia sp. TaxID=1872085 RepID=UPI002F931796
MRMQSESGLWVVGRVDDETPVVAVLEVSGAVLSWTVDTAGPPQIAFTALDQADWLWRVIGETGHVAVMNAIGETGGATNRTVEVDGVEILPGTLDTARRLAVGHWLRRWWPAGTREGIGSLDHAVLDAEIALLTVAAEDLFTDITFDSEVGSLLAPHAAAYLWHLRSGDRRVVDLVRRAVELAVEVGAGEEQDSDLWMELAAMQHDSSVDGVPEGSRQDDYSLAAGDGRTADATAIGRGSASIKWGGVPPRIFDAGENTATWTIPRPAAGSGVVAIVRTAVTGDVDPSGIEVSLRSGAIVGAAALDRDGTARVDLTSAGASVTETDLWDHNWSDTVLTVGVPVTESTAIRHRVRAFARGRVAAPPPDAFLAEILLGESDY